MDRSEATYLTVSTAGNAHRLQEVVCVLLSSERMVGSGECGGRRGVKEGGGTGI